MVVREFQYWVFSELFIDTWTILAKYPSAHLISDLSLEAQEAGHARVALGSRVPGVTYSFEGHTVITRESYSQILAYLFAYYPFSLSFQVRTIYFKTHISRTSSFPYTPSMVRKYRSSYLI